MPEREQKWLNRDARNRYYHARERLLRAVISLVGPGDQKTRLLSAMQDLVKIDPEQDLPEDMEDDFTEFMRRMASEKPTESEWGVEATVRAHPDRINEAAQKILELHNEVWERKGGRS